MEKDWSREAGGEELSQKIKVDLFNKIQGERRQRRKGNVGANRHVANKKLWSSILEKERK